MPLELGISGHKRLPRLLNCRVGDENGGLDLRKKREVVSTV